MKVEIVPALPEHIDAIAANPRPADVAELWAAARATPGYCMRAGLRVSVQAYTGLVDGVPACMFGVNPISTIGGTGVPWMVGSTLLSDHGAHRALLRLAREPLARMQAAFPFLCNAVDARNVAAIRWLKWLGFEFCNPIPCGPDDLPFLPFYREA